MTTKEKKSIQHDPFSNESRNNRIHEIQIECVQSKSSDIQQVYAEVDKLNDEDKDEGDDYKTTTMMDENIESEERKAMSSSASRASPPRRRKLKVKKKNKKKYNNHNKSKKSRKYQNDQDSENEGNETNEDLHYNDDDGNHYLQNGSKVSYSLDNDHDRNNTTKRNEMKRRVERIIIDQTAKLKRIHEITIDGLLSGHNCYVRARCKNINGWSLYCDSVDAQLPTIRALKFDLGQSSNAKGVNYILEDKCVVFEKTNQHHMSIANAVIDKKEYDTFEWKCIVDFDTNHNQKPHHHKNKKRKTSAENEQRFIEGICMGFVSYPLTESVTSLHSQLGTNGTQYGLFISNGSRDVHAYFTRDNSIHHTCSIKLNESVANGDEFKIICNMKRGKCDIIHKDQVLIDVFNSKIPNKIIPAISGYVINGNASCTIEYVSST